MTVYGEPATVRDWVSKVAEKLPRPGLPGTPPIAASCVVPASVIETLPVGTVAPRIVPESVTEAVPGAIDGAERLLQLGVALATVSVWVVLVAERALPPA